MKLMRVTAVDYEVENNETLIQLTGRSTDGRETRIVTDTLPYFYTREDDDLNTAHPVIDTSGGFKSYDGIPLTRVYTQTPRDTKSLAKQYETWESDIPYYRRCSIDYNLTGHIRVPEKSRCSIDEIETEVDIDDDDIIDPRIFIADIEVVMQGGKSFEEMKERAEDPISNITVWDSGEDEYISLYLDPDGVVSGQEVKGFLEERDGSESVSFELDRDIILRRYETEEALLNGFLSLFENRRPDLASGWNFVDFDWEYLLSRFEKFDDLNEHRLSDIGYINGYATERKVDCVPAFDMMDAYCEKMSWSNWRSKRLDYVAKEVLDAGKIPDVSVASAYENDRSRLCAYNIIDVMLCTALDRREGVHEFFYELAELSQIQIYDTFSEMRLVDGYLMSQGGDDEILPPQKEKGIPENAGGLVLDPSDGVKEWIGVLDLKSLYPSCIITWNISPETLIRDEETTAGPPRTPGGLMTIPMLPDADAGDGGQFTLDDIDFSSMWTDMSNEGLIPKYIKRLFPERAERKAKRDEYDPSDPMYDVWDRKQSAVKVIMNSFYGVMSNDYWRLGKYGLGDAVTSTARFALWMGKEIAVENGYRVHYGDTDSIMLELADETESKSEALERGRDLEERVNRGIGRCMDESSLSGSHPFLGGDLHGTNRHCLVYEFEKLYRRFFQAGKKKRYAGRIVWKEGKDVDGKIDTVGFESQRSDSPELTSEIQPEVINRILAGDGFDEVSEYVRGLIEDIRSRDIDLYKVGLPGAINQPLDEYGNTQTARACRFSNQNLDYRWVDGDDPWVYFIEETPPMTPGTDVLALEWDEDLPEGFTMDLDRTLERALEGPLSPILGEVGWNFTELKHGAQTQSAAGDWNYDSNNESTEADTDDWGW